MWSLKRSDLSALERGARLLGSGGAGDPSITRLLLEEVWSAEREVSVAAAEELPERCTVISVGLVGSVTAFGEKPAAGTEFTAAFDRLRELLPPREPLFVAAYESAGVNALIPLLVALQCDLPVADVDGMGRGLSWIDQTTYWAGGVEICPMVLASPAGHVVLLEDTPADEAERYVRGLTVQMGGWCAFAGYPVDRAACADVGVYDALRRCLTVGRAGSIEELVALPEEDCRAIASGRVVDVRWSYPEGYPRLSAVVQTSGPDRRPIRVEASNEFLLVVDRGEIVAQVPQIICLVEVASGRPLLAERVTPGTEVAIVVLAAPRRWLEPWLADGVALDRFGLDLPGRHA